MRLYLWAMDDARFIDYAAGELEKIGLIDRKDVIDGTLVRVPKAYPVYFGTYSQFERIRTFLDRFPNIPSAGTACIGTTIRTTRCWRPLIRRTPQPDWPHDTDRGVADVGRGARAACRIG